MWFFIRSYMKIGINNIWVKGWFWNNLSVKLVDKINIIFLIIVSLLVMWGCMMLWWWWWVWIFWKSYKFLWKNRWIMKKKILNVIIDVMRLNKMCLSFGGFKGKVWVCCIMDCFLVFYIFGFILWYFLIVIVFRNINGVI